MHGEWIPIVAIVSVFSYLFLKRYLDHQARMEALRRGVDPNVIPPLSDRPGETARPAEVSSPRPPKDHRLSSMIWIAVGLAFMVAAFLSGSARGGPERGLAVAVWGMIPLAVGIARYAYHASVLEGEGDCHRRSAFTLIAVGISFIVCVTLSTGMIKGMERAMAVGVWGLIPLSIGVVMYIYSGMVKRERADRGE